MRAVQEPWLRFYDDGNLTQPSLTAEIHAIEVGTNMDLYVYENFK